MPADRFVSWARGAALAATLAAAGCSNLTRPGASENPWTHHGRLVFAESLDTDSLNPMLASSVPTIDVSMFVFSYAVRFDERGRPVPDALREIPTVENGDVSPDGLRLTYRLRTNLRWQDGVPVTCRDLKFTVAAVLNPHNNVVTTDGYRDIASIACPSPSVAVVHMKRVYAPFLQQLWGVNGNAPIEPEHLLAKYNDDRGSFNHAPYQSLPIGSGPFRVTAWHRGDSVEMKAFDGFYAGRPKLDAVVFKYLPDENTMVDEVRTHEIDLAVHAGLSSWPALQRIGGYTASAPAVFTFDHVDFNMRRPLFGADRDLRRALALAIDRPELLRKIAFGQGVLTDTALSPQLSAAYDRHARHYPFDPAAARALLERDGWRVGPDGIRTKHGVRLAFTIGTQTEATTDKALEVQIQRFWHDVGAEASVKNYNTAQFFANSDISVLHSGAYDVAIYPWSGSIDPDDSAIYSARNMPPHGQNFLFWNDAAATAGMNRELATIEPRERLRGFTEEQERFAEEVPSLVLWYRHEPQIASNDLRGYAPSAVISPFWDPWNYSI